MSLATLMSIHLYCVLFVGVSKRNRNRRICIYLTFSSRSFRDASVLLVCFLGVVILLSLLLFSLSTHYHIPNPNLFYFTLRGSVGGK